MKNLITHLRHDLITPFRLLFVPFVAFLVIFTLSRLALSFWQYDRVAPTEAFSFIVLQGIRFDIVLLAMVFIIPAALTPLLSTHRTLFKYWRQFFIIYCTAWFGIIVFMEFSTPSFINQYDSRPNYIFVEYLKYFREVTSTLVAEYPLQLVAAGICVPLCVRFIYRFLKKLWQLERPIHPVTAIALVPVILVMFVMGGRSTLEHRAVNPSTVAITPDSLINDLPLNSTYTVLYSIYQASHEAQGGFRYTDMAEEDMYKIVKTDMHVGEKAFTDPEIPTLHQQTLPEHYMPVGSAKRPPNLVIVLEESLGAEFVGKLGGLPLTPNLDKLADEGVWFNNLYATGTRSVRGIEAIITGFPPTPAPSVVKLQKSQRNFFTIAQLLKSKGYDTSFIYGGESHFDNMGSFFLGNGFNYVVDQNDYENPVFEGSWGVSDEDLFNKAHETFSKYSDDQPFFSLVFTSSNHSPFQFPDGRIELYDEEKNTVNNAVKYADHAVGEFIAKAKQSNYWDNTLFLIIADHNSRVYGASLIPIERFHIPAILLGKDIKPDVINTLASQIDIAPTLLSAMGIESQHPMIGRDLNNPAMRKLPGRAIMQFNAIQAFMENGRAIVLQEGKAARTFTVANRNLNEEIETDTALTERAHAHSLFPQISYSNKLYRLGTTEGENKPVKMAKVTTP